jgi:hypothetical protein
MCEEEYTPLAQQRLNYSWQKKKLLREFGNF